MLEPQTDKTQKIIHVPNQGYYTADGNAILKYSHFDLFGEA